MYAVMVRQEIVKPGTKPMAIKIIELMASKVN